MRSHVPDIFDITNEFSRFGLPKQTQSFLFFQIDQVDAFRSNLTNLVPLITSAAQTQSNISEIRQVKINRKLAVNAGDGETVHPDVVTVSGVNIAFSATGLQKVSCPRKPEETKRLHLHSLA